MSAPQPRFFQGDSRLGAHLAVPACSGCGQHIDPANIRCPRCRRWFVTPPFGKPWGRLALAIGMLMLVLSGVCIEMAVQAILGPAQPDGSFRRDPIAYSETRALREP